jgi:hypothetical protein
MGKDTIHIGKKVVLFLTLYGLLAFYLGKIKFYEAIPRIFFGLSVFAISASLILLYFTGPKLRDFFDGIPMEYLSLFHAYRIFAGWAFILYQHQLPARFAVEAGYGDITAGFLGIIVFLVLRNKWGFLLLNTIGLADVVNALSHGLTLALAGDRAMSPIINLPMIMIPLFMVPPTIYIHVVALVRIFRNKI